MSSLLAGSLAKTIGSALANLFLPATLTRGGTTYPCKAIYEEWGKSPGQNAILKIEDFTILILATSLAVEPNVGDVISLQGYVSVIYSGRDHVAVAKDPASAVWTVLAQRSPIGTSIVAAHATLAAALGSPFDVYRSSGSNPIVIGNKLETLLAIFTNSRSTVGFSVEKAIGPDDFLWNVLADTSTLHVGDYLVGARTYFVAAIEPLTPVVTVLCNRVATVTRPALQTSSGGGDAPAQPSQPTGSGEYWGNNPAVDTVLATGIPVGMLGTTGRATGTGELPTDAPGPSRWRIYLPQSAFPKGSIQDRDIVTDEEGQRYQVSADYWSAIGYRVEAIRLEN